MLYLRQLRIIVGFTTKHIYMKPLYNLILLAGAIVLSVTACKKTNNEAAGTLASETLPGSAAPTFMSSATSLNKVFRELATTPETKCVSAGRLQQVILSKGTILTFYPNSFKDGTGKTITSGTVCVDVIEMQKPGDMIANRASTMTKTGYLLRSGGQVYIKATQNGQPVYARKYGIDFKQPAPAMQAMNLYFGNRQNKDSVVIWGDPMTATGMMVPGTNDTTPLAPGDTIVWGAGMYYQFDSCTDFDWVNCDFFYAMTGAKTVVKVVVADLQATPQNTGAYMVYPTLNAVVPLSVSSMSPLTFKTGEVPEGLNAHMVVVSKKANNQYYYWEALNFTVMSNHSMDAYPAPETIMTVKNKLSTLP